ncbi:MAG: glycosyltransferase family A protein [Rivularia sp. (in: cyanobacteria)]
METNPLVSVIIAVYNCEQYLAQAIESVLAQTYKAIEIIIVDDGSTDGSAQVAKSFLPQIKYHFQENRGVAAALNQGISLSQGKLIAFLDSDDLWVADKLTYQMRFFASNPDLEAVFGHVRQFKSPELDEASKQSIHIPVEVIPGYFKGTMLIKREAFERVGWFDSQWKLADFIDWYVRANEQDLRSFMLNNVLVKRRLHKTNMGIRERNSRLEYVCVLKASLDRRRNSTK